MLRNRLTGKGVTLIEVMIALVILLIVFLGVIQVALVSIQGNLKTVLRDEATAITANAVTLLRGTNFDDMDAAGGNDPSPLDFTRNQRRNVRNITWPADNLPGVPFGVAVNVVTLDADNKQITITTTWSWQGENFTHQVMTMRRR